LLALPEFLLIDAHVAVDDEPRITLLGMTRFVKRGRVVA